MKDFLKEILGSKGIDAGDTAAVDAIFTILKLQMNNQVKEYKKVFEALQEEEKDNFSDEERSAFKKFSEDIDTCVASATSIMDIFQSKIADLETA